MNNTEILDRFDSAERMLRSARQEYGRGRTEDALDLLRVAARNVARVSAQLDNGADVVPMQRRGSP